MAAELTTRTWLRKNVILHLNFLEAGWLAATVLMHGNESTCNRPDENGNPVPSTMKASILEEITKAVKEAGGEL